MFLNALKITLLLFLLTTGLLSSCEQPAAPPPPEEEPYFQPGEYGGNPLEGTEHLYNLQLSLDGSKIALIRSRTPGDPLDPRDQLWIVNADGSEPELIGYNIRGIDWSPDGQKLAFTLVIPQIYYTYIFTLRLDNFEVILWSGYDDTYFTKTTTSNPRWFKDNERLLVSVWGQAYQQAYERGLYILNTNDSTVKGPLVEVAAGGYLGYNDNYAIANKNLKQGESLSGNFIRYDFSKQNWHWITRFSKDSLRWVEIPRPNPNGPKLIYARHLDNAWQLFTMDSSGNNVHQLTELGGSEISWSKDGEYVYFNRDVHKAPGARFIPHQYELANGEIEVLWPGLPDSVPQFPSLETQNPIDFYAIVRDSSSNSN